MSNTGKLNRNQIFIIIAALTLNSVAMGKMIIISGFSSFSAEFPDVSLVTKQLLISIASLSGIPVTILMGKLVCYISKRTLGIISGLLFAIGGVLPIYVSNFTVMFIARCVMGFGMAMCSTIATVVIVEHFSGDLKNRLVGYNSAVKSLFGILFSYFGGLLARGGEWRNSYYLHAIGFAVAIVVFLFLPKDKVVASEVGEKESSEKIKMSLPVWYYSLAAFVMFLFFSAHGNNISLLFTETGIGTSSEAGIASAVFTLGGFISGIIFHKVYVKLREYTQTIGYLMAGVGILMIGVKPTFILICLNSFLFGLAFYWIISQQTLLVTGSVSAKSYTMAYAIYLSAINLGQVVSPLVLNKLSVMLFDNGVLGRYKAGGVGLIVMCVVSLLRILFFNKKGEKK